MVAIEEFVRHFWKVRKGGYDPITLEHKKVVLDRWFQRWGRRHGYLVGKCDIQMIRDPFPTDIFYNAYFPAVEIKKLPTDKPWTGLQDMLDHYYDRSWNTVSLPQLSSVVPSGNAEAGT